MYRIPTLCTREVFRSRSLENFPLKLENYKSPAPEIPIFRVSAPFRLSVVSHERLGMAAASLGRAQVSGFMRRQPARCVTMIALREFQF